MVRIGLVACGVVALLVLIPAIAVAARKPQADVVRVTVVHTPSGPVLANGNGLTLYVYIDDLLTKAPSACTGDCANDWPPALVPGRIDVAKGISGHIGTVERSDGKRQLTIDGRPLYTFSGDHSRGEIRGNGVGNIWWAMTPTGLSATSFPLIKSTYGPAAPTALTVVQTAVGSVVANDRGQVLYAYTDDTPTKSACNADWCLTDWPPLQAKGTPTAVAGITAPMTVINGAGGVRQVTLAGHPLYTFAGDLHPGDVRGQGIGADWLLIKPDGSLVGAKNLSASFSLSPAVSLAATGRSYS